MILYVRENEQTSCIKLVHFADSKLKAAVPSEMEANAKSALRCLPTIGVLLN